MGRAGTGIRKTKIDGGAPPMSGLTKHFPYFIEETTLIFIRLGLEVRRVVEFFKHCFFLRGHVLGCPDVDVDQLVASFIGVDAGEALAFQSEYLAALGAGWYFDLGFSVDGGYFCLQAEDCIGKGNV